MARRAFGPSALSVWFACTLLISACGQPTDRSPGLSPSDGAPPELGLSGPASSDLGGAVNASVDLGQALVALDQSIGDSGSDVGTDGQPIAHVTIDQLILGSNNFCVGLPTRGGNVGPCGASPVTLATCSAGMSGTGVTQAWQLNLVDDLAGASLAYLPFRFRSLHYTMSKGSVMSWKFKTPPASQVPSILIGGFGATTTPIGAEAPTFISVSTTRCDFNEAKVNTSDPCYRSIGGIGNSVDTRLSPPGTPPDAIHCELQPDTVYYLNFRWELAAGAARGIEACDPSSPYTQCGMVIDLR